MLYMLLFAIGIVFGFVIAKITKAKEEVSTLSNGWAYSYKVYGPSGNEANVTLRGLLDLVEEAICTDLNLP